MLSVYFADYESAVDAASQLRRYSDPVQGTYALAVSPFYDSLACLKSLGSGEPAGTSSLLRRVRKNQRLYKKTAVGCPANHGHKFNLVEAERARVKGQKLKAQRLYDEAIAKATENGFTQDAALALELAADFYLEIGEQEKALEYARVSMSHYSDWGARAKVAQVSRKYGLEKRRQRRGNGSSGE